MGGIGRITMFKVPNDEDIQAVLEKYSTLKEKATKEGKPYILDAHAHKTKPDPRNQGFTVVAHTTFSSEDDMKYYDTDCQAHKDLKSVVGPKQQGVMMVYYDA